VAQALGPIGNLGHHAVLYAQAGFEIFPVNPTDKSPLVSQYEASTDVEVIAAWWERWPGALIGHRISPDHVVLDVDPRHGGHATWAALRDEIGAAYPHTRIHLSGRGDGGGHVWLLNPGIKLSVAKLDAWAKERGLGQQVGSRWTSGIDILHHTHRYTILPPSPHPDTGAPYRWQPGHGSDVRPAVMPQTLVDLVTEDTPPPPRPEPGPIDPDSIADWYSQTQTWGALLGAHGWTLRGGDGESDGSRWRHPSATNAFSATVRYGCLFVYSPNTPFEVTEQGSPHGYTLFAAYAILEHDGDQHEAGRAARLAKGDAPDHSHDFDFMPASAMVPPARPGKPAGEEPPGTGDTDGQPTPLGRYREAVLATDSILNLQPPDFLIEGYLVRNSLAVLYGPSGSGKTFLALDWSLHVATGSFWHGQRVESGPVFYVIAEGVSGVGIRLDAWCKYHAIPDLNAYAPISWLPMPINLGRGEDVEALGLLLSELGTRLCVIDTLARCTLGVEENSAREMGVVVDGLDHLRQASGACILVVHHSGKDVALGARGSTALRAAMDTEIEIQGDEIAAQVKVTKQKDGFEARPRWLARQRVASSLVLVPATTAPRRPDDISGSALEAARALRQVDSPGGVLKSEWQLLVGSMPERTFFRARVQLLECGITENVGTDHRPRYRLSDGGRKLLEMADEGE